MLPCTSKALHFTAKELPSPEICGDAADPDGDGLANFMEYALVLDPKVPDSQRCPAPALRTIDGQTYLTVSFRRLPLANAIQYSVEVSDDLVHWRATAQPVGTPTLNADGTLTATYRDEAPISNSTQRFLRLRLAR